MKKQKIHLSTQGRTKLIKGINQLADAVVSTLGPNGRNAVYIKNGEVTSTKDGVSVAKAIEKLDDPVEDIGAQMVKQASINTSDKAGDGTTTSTLLTQQMVNLGAEEINPLVNSVEVKRGIDNAVSQVIDHLKKHISKDISQDFQLEQVAMISANNDVEVGKLISLAVKTVGKDGIVHIEESKTGETFLENVEGMQFDRGYKSHFFVTNNNEMSCTLENPYILIADEKFTQVKELLPILESVSSSNKSLLIIAEDIDHEALATLIVNKARGTIKVCAAKAPDFGDRRKLILEDIATLTGGQVFSKSKGMKLDKFSYEWFGEARVANITKDQTTIIDGKGDEEAINSRVEELQNQIDISKSPFEKEQVQDRLAKMVGGVSIIHVGGNSETEMKEKKDRVDDALHATKAVLEEGIIPGGGVALLFAKEAIIEDKSSSKSFKTGQSIVYRTCSSPFNKILENAGYSLQEIFSITDEILKKGKAGSSPHFGFDLKTETVVNMIEKGIIDPTKVCRVALENACSVAGIVLLTEAVIIDIPEDKSEESSQNMMQSMY